MSNVVDLFPPPANADITIGFQGDILEFKLTDLQNYVEGKGDLDPRILIAMVAVFHDLACEGFFEGE